MPLALVDLPTDLVAELEALIALLVVFLLKVELPNLFVDRTSRQAVHSDTFLADAQSLFEALVRLRRRASQLVQDGEVQQTVTARSIHRPELALSDGKGLAEASDGLVGHALLEVVHTNQEVGVARFQAVLEVELLDQLDVLDIA